MGKIRALIKSDRVVLFDLYGSQDSFQQSMFISDLQERLKGNNNSAGFALPFEFR